ncbi:hypothetical protein [Mycobacterium sp. AZCC_0083]|uniref:hypothetical protein n=1 Tax=Mycobacterium sp. AZCC_0083 TaxID=2735882 RepID=UPI00160861FE|nr:hypothetical protein [Mycobacterium sp. AZCC_0083]MBB5166740.1 hypothetical protein [Mycobacterium sp. AZCC_0083]
MNDKSQRRVNCLPLARRITAAHPTQYPVHPRHPGLPQRQPPSIGDPANTDRLWTVSEELLKAAE